MGTIHPRLLISLRPEARRFSSADRSRRRSGETAPFRTCTLLRIAVGSHFPYSVRSTRVSFISLLCFTGYQYSVKKSNSALLGNCYGSVILSGRKMMASHHLYTVRRRALAYISAFLNIRISFVLAKPLSTAYTKMVELTCL